MELELGSNGMGQYFTPYSVQSMMARMMMPGVKESIRREGFVTISDPASGAAGMIIAYAECLLDAGYDHSNHMFGSCIDIDPIAADMAFVQLSLLGYPGGSYHRQHADNEPASCALYPGLLLERL